MEMENSKEPTDETIIKQVTSGDTDAFEHLVRRYNERLYRVGMSYLKETALTEDTMQQAYLKAFLNLPDFEGRSSFPTWITRIMINECLMTLRAEKTKALRSEPLTVVREAAHSQTTTAETLIIEEEMRTTLEKAILQLPDKYRTIYMLREVEQLSTEEAAHCLNISAENVKVRLHRSKEAIKEYLLQTAEGMELFGYHLSRCDLFTHRVMQGIRMAAKNL